MLDVQRNGPILYCALNRPEVRNAFNDEQIAALTSVFHGLEVGVRAVVLSGNGKSFCAGGDLEWMRKAASYSEKENFRDALRLAQLFDFIAKCPAVVIARVHGAAYGGGCGLVAASDVAIASEDAMFSFSEVRLGLIPGTISSFVVPKIGAGNARALFVTGEAFSAMKAEKIGLVQEVCSLEELDALVESKLKAILLAAPGAISEAKRLAIESPLPIEECARRLAHARSSEEGKEGVAAFLERRKPSFAADLPLPGDRPIVTAPPRTP